METTPAADCMCTTWLIAAGLPRASPQEIVTLTSYRTSTGWVAVAARSWVSDLAGTGLEVDQMDPVIILEAATAELPTFHTQATDLLAELRGTDYEVADLFVLDP